MPLARKLNTSPQTAEIDGASASAVDQVLEKIRQLIVDGGLRVGDKLPTERELCERFSAGRNTVREAMRMLKAFGVVEVRPKVGATIVDHRMNRAFDLFSFNVTDISRRTFDDIQGFRELIETGSVIQIFAAIRPADLDDLHEINREMVRARTVIEASEQDLRFHTRLVSIIGNKSILDIYRIMTPVILRIMQRGKTRRTIEGATFGEHKAILDAIEKRDALGFQYLMRTHLQSGLSTFEDEDEPQENRL